MATKKTAGERMPEPEVGVPDVVETAEAVEAVIQKVHAFNAKRWRDVIRRSEEANDGLLPVVDRQGRYHAPKDGYIDLDSDRIFRGGSYLPFPEEYFMEDGEPRFRGGRFSAAKGWRYQERVRMPVESASALVAMGDTLVTKDKGIFSGYFEVSTGKSWEENGLTLCYAYIKAAYKPVLESIIRFASRFEYKRPVVTPETFPVWDEARRVITGTVISAKRYPNHYAGGTVFKMLVQSVDGNKTFGSVPSNMDEVEDGAVVEFEAKVVMKEPGFYYFKHPKAARVIQ